MDIENKPNPKRKRRVIGCARLHHNILLPNGDVVLCCTDFGMRHVLGNLLSQDYPSLFQSGEFLKVKRGQKDETLDILCRCCTDTTLHNVDLRAKIYNHFLPSLRNLFKRK